MELATLARVLGADTSSVSGHFQNIVIDSRRVQPGDVFFALQGENHDGHDFLDEAATAGAVCAIVSKPISATIPCITVADTRLALGALAQYWRDQFQLRVISLTGSTGKTSTKEMIASILSHAGPTLATQGNYNNEIGVPLTLWRLNKTHDFAVIELGANHSGEIAYTTRMVQPDVAVITNIGAAHLAGFGSLDGVAAAKSEIFEGLSPKGVAVLNRDDAYYSFMQEKAGEHSQLSFGLEPLADVHVLSMEIMADKTHLTLKLPTETLDVTLSMPGLHNVKNALAAAAATHALGVETRHIKAGLETVKGVPGRLQRKKGKNQCIVIDDTYNANPTSTQAAIDYLSHLPQPRLLILGDMGELGDGASELHRGIGEYAKSKGVLQLYTCGSLCAHTAKAFGQGAIHFSTQEALLNHLHQSPPVSTQCLVKGSRSACMETIVAAMVEG